jgi:hypothetical protein
MLLPAQGCRRAAQSTFGGTLVVQASSCVSTAIPAAFPCLSGRVGALVPLPAELAARNCRSGEMRVPGGPIDHPPFGCEQVHPTSPCKQLGKLVRQGVPLSLSLSAATRAPPGRDDTRGLTHQPPTSRRVAGMLGRGGQTSSHRAPGGVAARPAPLRANLSVFGRIVCHPSIRLASLGSCRAPPHPERTYFRPLPSPRGGTASLAASSERPRSWPAGR